MSDFNEFFGTNEIVTTNKKIDELEKEIRLLKTDISIIQYGYGGEND